MPSGNDKQLSEAKMSSTQTQKKTTSKNSAKQVVNLLFPCRMNLNPRHLPRATRAMLYAMKIPVNARSMKDYQSAADLQKPPPVDNTAMRRTRG